MIKAIVYLATGVWGLLAFPAMAQSGEYSLVLRNNTENPLLVEVSRDIGRDDCPSPQGPPATSYHVPGLDSISLPCEARPLSFCVRYRSLAVQVVSSWTKLACEVRPFTGPLIVNLVDR